MISICFGPSVGVAFCGQRTSSNIPLVEINIGLLAYQIRVPTTDTLDLGQGVHDLLPTLDIGVEETQDELEVRLLPSDERYK